MLTRIHIQDFAIIDALSVELGAGMTALTGETGAGKSILVDALRLVLGDRAEAGMIRHGAQRAEIIVELDISNEPEAIQWLEDQGLDNTECLLRRVIQQDGKSRCWINGTPVTLQAQKSLGEKLVDIHGQNAHQSLMHRSVQREILDDHAGHADLLETMKIRFMHWQKLHARVQELQNHRQAGDARRDLLRFQVDELEALAMRDGEWQELEVEQSRLANAERLLELARTGHDMLYEQELSIDSMLGRFLDELEQGVQLDAALDEPRQLLASAHIQIREAAQFFRRHAETLEFDPSRLDFIDSRMAAMQGLARKHRVEPDALPALLVELEKELRGLEQDLDDSEELIQSLNQARSQCEETARALGLSRQRAAEGLSAAITGAMQELGMEGGVFSCRVTHQEGLAPSVHGMDEVEFLVSANPGQPQQPLTRVASGGELSRISLAIQMIAARALPISSLIFDEVDVGIGGAVAEVVGRQLRQLARHRQVLCVTHLPQVASQAHHHLRVVKHKGPDRTSTRIDALDTQGRIQEVARMLGGVELTPQSLAHAEDMIVRAGVDQSGF